MIDVDPGFRAAHEAGRGSKAALGRSVQGNGHVEILRIAQRRLEVFAAREKSIFLEEAVLIPHHYFFPQFREGKAKPELAAERVPIRPDVAQDGKSFLGAEDRADF